LSSRALRAAPGEHGAVSAGRAFMGQRPAPPPARHYGSRHVKIVALLCLVGFLGIIAIAFLSPETPAPPGIPLAAR
jgi:hypothetical protein